MIKSIKATSYAILTAIVSICATNVFAQIPANYYNDAYGKSGYALQVALSEIIDDHTVLVYGSDYPGGLWYAFRTSDVRPDGTVWDIYSNCSFIPWEDGHVAGSGECTCTQQEHTFCQSWFGYDYECAINSDMFHIYPVDGWINGRRSNYPYGEVPNDSDWVTRTFINGARLGYNAYVAEDKTSYCDIAYEPIDEYKGDIARGFFYIATRYMFEDDNFSEDYDMTYRSQLRPWAMEMLKKWNERDSVSQKEIDRNNIIYSQFQFNRNPYIDYPELVELVFGADSANTKFDTTLIRKPTNFSILPDSIGYLKAYLAWTNPDSRINNTAASSISSIVIKRNGVIVNTIANPQPGQAMSWTDNTVPTAGVYHYEIFATDNGKNGLLSSGKAYIGQYCKITATLYDAYYDGWQGEARIEFQDTLGNVLGFSKLPCGEGWENVYEIMLPLTTINCVWVQGDYDNEIAFELSDIDENILYTTDYYYDSNIDDYYSDVENLSGSFLTFNNNACPVQQLPEPPADVVTIYLYDSICHGATYNDNGFSIPTKDSLDGIHQYIKMQNDTNTYLYLTVTPAYNTYIYDSICQGSIYNDNGFIAGNEGTHILNLKTADGCDSTVTLQLSFKNCTGIGQNSTSQVTIHPNPATAAVTLTIEADGNGHKNFHLDICDITGRVISKQQVKSSSTISLSDLANGIYFFKISSDDTAIATKKVVKQ